jgi:integrase
VTEVKTREQYWLSKPQEVTIYGEMLERDFRGKLLEPHYIYFKKMIDGVDYKFSTGETDPELAYKAAPKMLKARMNEGQKKAVARNIFQDFIPQFMEYKNKQLADGQIKQSTLKVVERTLPHILPFWKNKFFFKLDQIYDVKLENNDCWQKQFDAYVDWFRVNNEGSTMFNVVKYLNQYVNWMHKNGIIRIRLTFKDPNAKLERRKRKIENTRILSQDDLKSLLEVANERQRFAIMFGYFMAFRISDVSNLDWKRVNLDPKDPYVEFLGEDKEGHFSKGPINPILLAALIDRKSTSVSPWVFPQVRDESKHAWPQDFELDKLFQKAGLLEDSFHLLRHTRLTLDFGNPKIPDSDVMIMRRVSYEVALEHYIHPSTDNRTRMVVSDSAQLSQEVKQIMSGPKLVPFKEN